MFYIQNLVVSKIDLRLYTQLHRKISALISLALKIWGSKLSPWT